MRSARAGPFLVARVRDYACTPCGGHPVPGGAKLLIAGSDVIGGLDNVPAKRVRHQPTVRGGHTHDLALTETHHRAASFSSVSSTSTRGGACLEGTRLPTSRLTGLGIALSRSKRSGALASRNVQNQPVCVHTLNFAGLDTSATGFGTCGIRSAQVAGGLEIAGADF